MLIVAAIAVAVLVALALVEGAATVRNAPFPTDSDKEHTRP